MLSINYIIYYTAQLCQNLGTTALQIQSSSSSIKIQTIHSLINNLPIGLSPLKCDLAQNQTDATHSSGTDQSYTVISISFHA